MADNLKDTGRPDRDLINMHEAWELQYWSKKWDISVEQLKAAGIKAGSSSVCKVHDAAVAARYMNRRL